MTTHTQQAPTASDLPLPFSVEYAHEWWLRFGEGCPISGDAIALRKESMPNPSFWAGANAYMVDGKPSPIDEEPCVPDAKLVAEARGFADQLDEDHEGLAADIIRELCDRIIFGVSEGVADEVRAASWAEGYNIGVERAMTGQRIAPAPNPYRK